MAVVQRGWFSRTLSRYSASGKYTHRFTGRHRSYRSICAQAPKIDIFKNEGRTTTRFLHPNGRAACCVGLCDMGSPCPSSGGCSRCDSAARHAMGSMERNLLSTALRMLQCSPSSRRYFEHRGRIFLRTLVGFLDRFGWQCDRSSIVIFSEPIGWSKLVGKETLADFGVRSARTRSP